MRRLLLRSLLLACLCACAADKGAAKRSDGGHAAGGAGGDAAVALDAGSRSTAATDAGAAHDAAGSSGDGGDVRHFRLATTGAQLVVTGPELGLQLTPANVTDDSDVVSVHQEFYGVPWDAFEAKTAPPAEWVALMERFAQAARAANKPVFLSISMLNGKRESLAAKTSIEGGAVKSKDDWSAKCYDFASASDGAAKKAAYLRYVAYMVAKFQPEYLNVAIEVNLFFEKCPAATAGLIGVINAAYDQVKAAAKRTLVFPSIQIDHLYGYSSDSCPEASMRAACFDQLYAVLAPIKRDRFAMSSYPYMSGIAKPADLPADWFTRGAARAGETPLIAETGWPSTDIVVKSKDGVCSTYFSFDEQTSAAYLGRVLADADAKGLDLVTWWSDRDLLVSQLMTNCPCTFDATWCSVLDIFRGPAPVGSVDTQLFGELLLKVFGTMGLRSYDGTPKPMHMQLWNAVHARRYSQ